jgi:PhnB protein
VLGARAVVPVARKIRPRSPAKPPADPPIPTGFGTVTPHLVVAGGDAALEFYQRAFGAKLLMRRTAPDGRILHARLRFGDSIVMLSDAFPGSVVTAPSDPGSCSVTVHLYSTDVDRLWSRAVQAGAKVARPLENQFWGERYGQLVDPFGHRWSLAQPVRMHRAEKKVLEEQAMAMFARGPAAGGEEPAEPA